MRIVALALFAISACGNAARPSELDGGANPPDSQQPSAAGDDAGQSRLCQGGGSGLSFGERLGNIASTGHFLFGQPLLVIDADCNYWSAGDDLSSTLQELRTGHLDDAMRQQVERDLRLDELQAIGSESPGTDGGGSSLASHAGVVNCPFQCQGADRSALMNRARELAKSLWDAGEPSDGELSVAAYPRASVSLGGDGTPAMWPDGIDLVALGRAEQGLSIDQGVGIEDASARASLRALRSELGTSYFEVDTDQGAYAVMIRDDLPPATAQGAAALEGGE